MLLFSRNKTLYPVFYRFYYVSTSQHLFEATLDFRAIGSVIYALETLPSSDIPPAIRSFLEGKLNPPLVTVKDSVVPHLVALLSVLDSRVIDLNR